MTEKYNINPVEFMSKPAFVPEGVDLNDGNIIVAPVLPDEPVHEISAEEFARLVKENVNYPRGALVDDLIDLANVIPANKGEILVALSKEGTAQGTTDWEDDTYQFTWDKDPMVPNSNRVVSDVERDVMRSKIAVHFREIIKTLGFDTNDKNLRETPERVAKMYVDEIFSGCYNEPPKITTFDTKSSEMVYLGDIDFTSTCSHHFVFFIGKAYIAYIPDGKLIGISKLARITDWFAKRPQLQEDMTTQIADMIMETIQPHGCAVHIEAQHGCMTARGVSKPGAKMKTTALRGCFKEPRVENEFFNKVMMDK